MENPKEYYVFRPIDGLWQSAEGIVLADYLARRGMVVDDRTHFLRLYDYDTNECILYRAYGSQKVTITVNNLNIE